MKNRKGFTLVEIMIVVAIIALLVAIAVPNIARSRLTANTTAALGSIRTLSTAMESYNAATGEYPTTEARLTQANPPYYSRNYWARTVGNYLYTWDAAGTTVAYTLNAVPTGTSAGDFCYQATTGGTMWRSPYAGPGTCIATTYTTSF